MKRPASTSWLLAAAVASGLALTLVGCAAAPGDGSATTPEEVTSIRIANEALVTSLDPSQCITTECRRLYYLTNGYLTQLNTGEPDLAESLEPDVDNTVWTVTLREGLTFSDGSQLNSEDVVASFQRYLEPPYAGSLEVFNRIESVEATDALTVVITLTQPDADFRSSIATVPAAIYPSDQLNEPGFFDDPVGAGEYILSSHNLSTGDFSLESNPKYWGPEPQVTSITFSTVSDGATRLAQVQSGQVDYAKSLPANLLSDLPDNLRIERVQFPGGMIHLVFNNYDDSTSITTDVRIRQAIDLAVDREQIATVALAGYMDPLFGMPWLDPADRPEGFERDLDQAKELLRGTACEDGCSLRFVNITDFNWQLPLSSTIVQQNLADIGIEVELINTTFASVPTIPSDQWDGIVLDPGSNVMTDASIGVFNLTTYYWWGDAPQFPDLAALVDELAVAPVDEAPAIREEINRVFTEQVPWVGLTDLTFLDVTSLPESVISSPVGWRLLIG